MTRAVKTLSIVLAAAVAAVAGVHTFAAQAEARLRLQLEDYAQLPITGELDGQNTRGQLARVNFMREEPGGRRFFVNDLNGPLYILDKQTKKFTVYLDFNGLGGRPGLFPKFTFERNFATGLTNVVFDPDYARNGIFYTLHMEDPSGAGSPAPKPGVVAGLDLSGYTTTAAVPTPTVDGKIEREVVLIEWKDRNPANATFEGTARELLRVQHPLPQHPLGEMTFNPVARRGDADWRVMYLGAGDSRRAISATAAGSTRSASTRSSARSCASCLTSASIRRPARSARTAATASPPTTPSPHSRAPARRSGPTACAIRIGRSGTSIRRSRTSRDCWPSNRPGVVGDGRRRPQGRELRLAAARGHAGAIAGRDGPDSGRRHDPDPHLRHRDARHGHASLSGAHYPHRPGGGDAIANGFIYRGKQVPALKDKLVFGDITTGRIWYAERAISSRRMTGSRRRSRRFTRSRPGFARWSRIRITRGAARAPSCPARRDRGPRPGRPALRGRRCRRALHPDETDGMIRKVVGASVTPLRR